MKTAKEIYMYLLGTIIVIGFFTTLALVLTNSIPETNIDTANQTLGALLMAFGMVVSFFFGSSKGSADKTDLLSNK